MWGCDRMAPFFPHNMSALAVLQVTLPWTNKFFALVVVCIQQMYSWPNLHVCLFLLTDSDDLYRPLDYITFFLCNILVVDISTCPAYASSIAKLDTACAAWQHSLQKYCGFLGRYCGDLDFACGMWCISAGHDYSVVTCALGVDNTYIGVVVVLISFTNLPMTLLMHTMEHISASLFSTSKNVCKW